jgi:hypothetical protein
MRITNLLLLVFVVCLAMQADAQERAQLSTSIKNFEVKAKYQRPAKDVVLQQTSENLYVANPNKSFSDFIIGNTEYDVQSNKSVDTRIYLYPDNTIGAAFTYGLQASGFANRGTGYNYFNGTSWDAAPTTRIESVRTGWGSYASFNNGEVVVAHDGIKDLIMNTRPTKGTGTWTQSTIVAPTGVEMTWPRVMTNGNSIHILSTNYLDSDGMESPIYYSRSTDGGSTWTHQILPGMDFASGQLGYAADHMAWAKPKNGVIAFIVGNMWHDIYIMKSTDDGATWTKILVFDHPNPFTFQTMIPLDTTYVTDGLMSLEIDNTGKLHAAFGVANILVEDPTSEEFSWFPFAGFLGYWNENMGILTDMSFDAMDAAGAVIGDLLDLDGDPTTFAGWNGTNFDQFVSYGNHGMVSQPQLTIDNNDHLYVTFAHVNETMLLDTYFRHIWARKSIDGGATWSNYTEVTGGPAYEFFECVFGAMAKNSDNYIHMIFQSDDLPGLGVAAGGTPDHSIHNNNIVYIRVLKSDIGTTSADISEYNSINSVSIYPNPASDNVTIVIASPVKVNASLNMMNILGQSVMSQNIDVRPGNNTVNLNVNNLPTGIYIVNVEAGKYRNSQKLIVK